MAVMAQEIADRYAAYNGDCVEVMQSLPDGCAHVSIYSPPFAEPYNYSSSEKDLSNCATYEEFLQHYEFVIEQISRLTMRGRVSCVHCMDLRRPSGKEGVRDFPGDIIRMYERHEFWYVGRHIIWKEPLRAAIKTRALGLRHGQLVKDSSKCHVAGADYLLVFRKDGESPVPIEHAEGLKYYAGAEPVPEGLLTQFGNGWTDQRTNKLSQLIWQRYASSVWLDIRVRRVVEFRGGRDSEDEKHICLARGSLILTKERGYVPIQDVSVGEHALTHMGRWRPVLLVKNTGTRPVITVRAQGVPRLTLTPDHQLWARKSTWSRERDGAERTVPEWIEAQATLGGYLNLKIPDTEEHRIDDPLHWWIVGRWLADGHFDARGGLHISCGANELDELLPRLGGYAGSIAERTAMQVRINDRDGRLRETLSRCGVGAASKHLPPEAFMLQSRFAEAILSGYLSGDGHFCADRGRWMASSISRDLLLGIAMLAQRVHGSIASIYAGRCERDAEIQGRIVHCRQDWVLSFDVHKEHRKQPFILDDGAWKKVRSIEDAGEAETWCLKVADDESFTAEGCVVKNCPLQLDVIERCLTLYSNPGEVMLTPFMGVGSEICGALGYGRRGLGVELKESYYRQALANIKQILTAPPTMGLFDYNPDDEDAAEEDVEEAAG